MNKYLVGVTKNNGKKKYFYKHGTNEKNVNKYLRAILKCEEVFKYIEVDGKAFKIKTEDIKSFEIYGKMSND